ncbi:MAG: bifunctional oligoribonuclease/PAP phosphatase NrnA [Paludibacter sp.]|nr:bifunctional oligoribonuclease/PAP phosphatase NrnA [Paludibacter sp.]
MLTKIIAEDLVRKVQEHIDEAEKIVIVAHIGPDGDAVGSSLGLWHYLMTLGKEPTVILPSVYPNFLAWMPGIETVLDYKNYSHKKTCEEKIAEADLIFILDLNEPKRMDELSSVVLKAAAPKILIDHHIHPADFTKITISYPEFSSTSEIIFRLICRMGDFDKINLGCAECIYTGMMTDTGGFTFNSNKQEIYSIIYELLRIGVDKDDIYRKVYNTYSADRMRLVGYSLSEKMKLYPEYKTALITLSLDELKRFNHQVGDTEGLVNMPLQIKDVIFSIFVRQDPDKTKISFRSQGTFPANKVAADLFGGGGHLNAAGGESYEPIEDIVKKIENALPDYSAFL